MAQWTRRKWLSGLLGATVGGILFGWVVRAMGQQVVTEVDPKEPVGARPYEMEWANRQEPRPPTLTFPDLRGWRMEVSGGAVATFRPSRERNVWNRLVGKLTYRGNGDPKSQPRILLFPPKPVPIPDGSDSVELWVYGNRWAWENPPDTPPTNLFAHLRDEQGQMHRIHLAIVGWKEWWLVHRKLPTKTKGWHFVALEIAGGWQPQDRTLYFDSVTFYAEPLPPLRFPSRPRRNLTLFEGQSPGLNTGRKGLEFPTREETILPINLTNNFRTEVQRFGNVFVFRYAGQDGEVVYRFDASEGLSSLEAFVKGGRGKEWGTRQKEASERVGRVMVGGGVRFADGGREGRLVFAQLRNGVVTARYERGVTYRFRLWQKSLVLDVLCPNAHRPSEAEAVAFDFGEMQFGHNDLRLLYVPFITYGGNQNPVVAMVRGLRGVGQVFVSIWLDWYRSNGSEPYAFPNGEWTLTGIRINGGVRYHPRTDGKRNDMFERVFLTVSPLFEEVLPVVPNPKGLHASLAVDRLWQESWGPANYEQEMARSRKLRAYGIVKLIQCNHELTWRDGGESFTLRTRAAPGKGGDEALQRYLAHQKSLGWFAGLYTNYCDFAPVNEHWNPDYVQRTSDGNWRPAWPRCYALKPAAAVMFHELLAPVIKRKFHPDGKQISAYTDVHTAITPWYYCDYDARVLGAGTFVQTFYCYGELLRNDSRIYGGPIFSEGTFQWLYAGLADGNYALTYNNRPIAREPLLPIFYLREIHTKECGIGMGWTDWFLQGVPDWQKDVDTAIDRFLLHTIAYGNIGWLVEERFGMERVCRSYYMLQRLQKRYGLQSPQQIAYFDGKKLVSVSKALAQELPETRRQLFIAYPNGLRIWLNDFRLGTGDWDGREGVWEVKVNGAVYQIPPAGWLAVQGKEFLTFSALLDGHKVDFLRDAKGYGDEPPLLYADGRGRLTRFGEVAIKGPAALRKLSERTLEVLDIAPTGEFGLRNPLGVKGIPVRCEVFDLDGKLLGEAELRITPDYAWVIGKPGGHRYVVHYSAQGRGKRDAGRRQDWWVRAETHEAPPGASLPLRVEGVDPKEVALQCLGGKLEGLTLFVPEDAPIGARIWVRSEWRGEVKWWDVTVVPMVQWRASLRPRGDGQGELLLRARWCLHGLGKGSVTVALHLPEWVTAKQTSWLFPTKRLPETLRTYLRAEVGAKREGEMVVMVRRGRVEAKQAWRLQLVDILPFSLRLDKVSVPFVWGIRRRGGKEQPDDGKSGATFYRHAGMPVGGVVKPGFFSHPPYIGGVGYVWARIGPLTLPNEPCLFRSWVGLMDGGDPSDGALFIVEVEDEKSVCHRLAEQLGVQGEWRELVADLTPFAGQKIWLRLLADVGPNDNSIADWASWGEPRLESKQSRWQLKLGQGE